MRIKIFFQLLIGVIGICLVFTEVWAQEQQEIRERAISKKLNLPHDITSKLTSLLDQEFGPDKYDVKVFEQTIIKERCILTGGTGFQSQTCTNEWEKIEGKNYTYKFIALALPKGVLETDDLRQKISEIGLGWNDKFDVLGVIELQRAISYEAEAGSGSSPVSGSKDSASKDKGVDFLNSNFLLKSLLFMLVALSALWAGYFLYLFQKFDKNIKENIGFFVKSLKDLPKSSALGSSDHSRMDLPGVLDQLGTTLSNSLDQLSSKLSALSGSTVNRSATGKDASGSPATDMENEWNLFNQIPVEKLCSALMGTSLETQAALLSQLSMMQKILLMRELEDNQVHLLLALIQLKEITPALKEELEKVKEKIKQTVPSVNGLEQAANLINHLPIEIKVSLEPHLKPDEKLIFQEFYYTLETFPEDGQFNELLPKINTKSLVISYWHHKELLEQLLQKYDELMPDKYKKMSIDAIIKEIDKSDLSQEMILRHQIDLIVAIKRIKQEISELEPHKDNKVFN